MTDDDDDIIIIIIIHVEDLNCDFVGTKFHHRERRQLRSVKKRRRVLSR